MKLETAKIKAEEATQTKANFLANMSHEIRTPMNSIVSMSYLIKQSNLNDIQYKYVQNIQTASNNLLKLLNDILDYSKIEAKKLELHNVNFNLIDILDNVTNITQVKANEKELNFSIDYDKSINMNRFGDSQRLIQILTNLLSNAIKFTDIGKVELSVQNLEDDIFLFIISDTGIGISEEEASEIFNSFTQADSSTTRRYGGSGLGLSISQELVKLMGGKISVDSKLGSGSRFSFEVELKVNNLLIQKEVLSNTSNELSQNNITNEDTLKLFQQLNNAVSIRRPQLCQPIIEELELSTLSLEDKELFLELKELINKYKFKEAKVLLDAK